MAQIVDELVAIDEQWQQARANRAVDPPTIYQLLHERHGGGWGPGYRGMNRRIANRVDGWEQHSVEITSLERAGINPARIAAAIGRKGCDD